MAKKQSEKLKSLKRLQKHRQNCLKELINLKAPEIIIDNQKRLCEDVANKIFLYEIFGEEFIEKNRSLKK